MFCDKGVKDKNLFLLISSKWKLCNNWLSEQGDLIERFSRHSSKKTLQTQKYTPKNSGL